MRKPSPLSIRLGRCGAAADLLLTSCAVLQAGQSSSICAQVWTLFFLLYIRYCTYSKFARGWSIFVFPHGDGVSSCVRGSGALVGGWLRARAQLLGAFRHAPHARQPHVARTLRVLRAPRVSTLWRRQLLRLPPRAECGRPRRAAADTARAHQLARPPHWRRRLRTASASAERWVHETRAASTR